VVGKTFTPAQANDALAVVRPAAQRLVKLRTRMRELERAQSKHITSIGGNGVGYAATDLNDAQTELAALAHEALACVDRLGALGVVVKDADLGLLDFPAVRAGEEVLLCWRVGEERVETWHAPEEGFAGRKPIDWGE